MFWGDFPKDIRMAEQKSFMPPSFTRYKKPKLKYVNKDGNGPIFIIKPKCNDCPFDKITVKTCKRCRCN